MPTYEYACRSCGEHLEVVQSFRDDALTECPACGGQLRKVFGAIGIAFKGSGFYSTDSRDKSSSKARTDSKDKPASSKDKAATSTGDKSGSSSGSSSGSGSGAGSGSGTGSGSGSGSGSGDKSTGSSSGKGDSKAAASS